MALTVVTGMGTSTAAPLALSERGYFFVNGQHAKVKGGDVVAYQMYVEFQKPIEVTAPYPVVMIHGRGQTGTNFTGTPDGREGWADYFTRRGYAVYVVDQPGRGRSGHRSEIYGPTSASANLLATLERRFTATGKTAAWPQARLHTQWPGPGIAGDPIFEQFAASQVEIIPNDVQTETLLSGAAVALLDRIGPAILLTHSQSGPSGWQIANLRRDRVKAVVAVEPNGPPFHEIEFVGAPSYFKDGPLTRPTGVTNTPIEFDPPIKDPSELVVVREPAADRDDLVRCWMQGSPARRIAALQKIPVALVTAEASYRATYDHCTVKFLKQAGVAATHIVLAELGIRGNGHMMMLEKNNLDISKVIADWLDQHVGRRRAGSE
jgi:pimeloyl-ACP methyl ester carboxylesterase